MYSVHLVFSIHVLSNYYITINTMYHKIYELNIIYIQILVNLSCEHMFAFSYEQLYSCT